MGNTTDIYKWTTILSRRKMYMKVRINKKVGRAVAWLMAAVMLLGMAGYMPGNSRLAEAAAKRDDYWNGLVATRFAGGNGTKDHPYLIKWGSQLAYLAELVNKGDKNEDGLEYSKAYYSLISDIQLNDLDKVADWKTKNTTTTKEDLQEWTAIGISNDKPFAGVFDGDGHTISGLWTVSTDTNGLFGCVVESGYRDEAGNKVPSVMNTNISSSFVEGSGLGVGALVGKNGGVIENCHVEARVVVVNVEETDETGTSTGNDSNKAGPGGGVAGANLNQATINNCSSSGGIYGVNMIGGITGLNRGEIRNCYNTAKIDSTTALNNVTAYGAYGTGGIAGYNDHEGEILNCYNRGDVASNGNAGGIAGINLNFVANCYNHAAIDGDKGYAGEIAGTLQRVDDLSVPYKGKVAYSYWTIRKSETDPGIIINAPCVGYDVGALVYKCYSCDAEHANPCKLKDGDDWVNDLKFTVNGAQTEAIYTLKDALNNWRKASDNYCGKDNTDTKYNQWAMDAGTPSLPVYGVDDETVWDGSEDKTYDLFKGDGTENSPYRIDNEGQLLHLARLVDGTYDDVNNRWIKANTFEGKYFILTKDLKLNNDKYKFTFTPDTGLMKVECEGYGAVYAGTGINGDDTGTNEDFDKGKAPSVVGKWYKWDTVNTKYIVVAENTLDEVYQDKIDTATNPGPHLHRWTPIGVRKDAVFKGSFIGNGEKGKTISGLFVNGIYQEGNDDKLDISSGLFGNVVAGTGNDEETGMTYKLGCELKNITIKNSCVIGTENDENNRSMQGTGALVGYIEGDIVKCNVDKTVVTANKGYLGGVAGYIQNVRKAVAEDEIKDNNHKIFGAGFSGSVFGAEETYEGGIVGYCGYGNTIEECYSGPVPAGGVFDDNPSKVYGRAQYMGGICGCNYGSTIINSWNEYTVENSIKNEKNKNEIYVGGIAGNNESKGKSIYPDQYDDIYASIVNSYNTGIVKCPDGYDVYIGGIVGRNRGGTIFNVYTDKNLHKGTDSKNDDTVHMGDIAGNNAKGEGRFDFVNGNDTQKMDIYNVENGTIMYSYSAFSNDANVKAIDGKLASEANENANINVKTFNPPSGVNLGYNFTNSFYGYENLYEELNAWIADIVDGGSGSDRYLEWKVSPNVNHQPRFGDTNYRQTSEKEPLPIYKVSYDPNVGGSVIEKSLRNDDVLSGDIKSKDYQMINDAECETIQNDVNNDKDKYWNDDKGIYEYMLDDGREVPVISKCKYELDGFRFIGWCTDIDAAELTVSRFPAPKKGCKIFLKDGLSSITETGLINDFNPADYVIKENSVPDDDEITFMSLTRDTTLYAIWESTRVNVTKCCSVEKQGNANVYKLREDHIDKDTARIEWDKVTGASYYWVYRYKLGSLTGDKDAEDTPDFYNNFDFDNDAIDKLSQRFEVVEDENLERAFPREDNKEDAVLEPGVYYYGVRSISKAKSDNNKSGSSTLKVGPMSLTVRVEIKSKDIVYHRNAGENDTLMSEDAGYIVGNPAEIKENEFTRIGYTFMGWNSKEDGTAKVVAQNPGDADRKNYAAGETITVNDTYDAADGTTDGKINMYAVWQLNRVNLKVESDASGLKLVWNQHEADDIDGYYIYSSEDKGDGDDISGYAYLATVGKDVLTYPIVKGDTIKYYVVIAYKSKITGEGELLKKSITSNKVSDAMLDLNRANTADNTGIEGKTIYLKWDKVDKINDETVNGYEIFRSRDPEILTEPGIRLDDYKLVDDENKPVKVQPADNTEYEDIVPEVGTYYYQVRPYAEKWVKGDDGEDRLAAIEYGALSIMCKVEMQAVDILFDSNIVSGADNNPTHNQTTGLNFTVKLDKNEFENEGFVFAGWSKRWDRIIDPLDDEAEITVTEGMTLYAIWDLNKPVLKLNDEGSALVWDANPAIGSIDQGYYEVYRKTNNGEFENVATVEPSGDAEESYTLGALDKSSTYVYYVKAYHYGDSDPGTSLTKFSESDEYTIQPPEDQVRNVECQVNPDGDGSHILITWDPVNAINPKGYHVFRVAPGSDEKKLIATVSDTSYTDTGIVDEDLGPGLYQYYVRAYTADGKGEYYKTMSLPGEATLEAVEVTYRANGGIGADQTYTYIKNCDNVQVIDCPFGRDNYQFIEWYATVGEDEIVYTTDVDEDGNNDVIDADVLDSDITFNARWKLQAITDLTAAKASATSIRLNWTTNRSATGYDIYQKKGTNGDFEHIAVIDNSVNSYVADGIDITSLYEYKLVPYEDIPYPNNGLLKVPGMESNIATVEPDKDVVIAGQVTGINGVVNEGDVDLTWDKLDDTTGYYIYRRTDNAKPADEDLLTIITSADTVEYKDTDIDEVVPYYYTIRGYKETYTDEGELSATHYLPLSATIEVVFEKITIDYISGNNGNDTIFKDYVKGSKVNILANPFEYPGRVFVSWNTNPLGKGYEYAAGESYDIDANMTLYAIWRLERPENVKAKLRDDKKTVDITWGAVDGADGYVVYRKDKNAYNAEAEVINTIDNGNTGYTDTLADELSGKDDGYYYFVRAYEKITDDTRRLSDFSEATLDSIVGSVNVEDNILGAPTNLKVLSYESDNSARIGWSGVPEADGYFIFRSKGPRGDKVFTGIDVEGNNVNTGELDLDVPYYYYVVAYIKDKINDTRITGGYSEGIEVLITSPPTPSSTPEPEPEPTANPYGKVENLAAESEEFGKVDIAWDALRGFTNYEVHIAENSDMDGKEIRYATDTEYTLKNMEPGKTLYISVRAYEPVPGEGIHYSDMSDIASVYVYGVLPTPTVTPEETEAPAATDTPEPDETESPEPGETAAPEPGETESPEPDVTATPEPVETAAPEPGETATPEPVETIAPEPTAAATASPEATIDPLMTPAPTEDPSAVNNYYVKDAYNQYINLIWDKAPAAYGYEISYSTQLDGEKIVINVCDRDTVELKGEAVTGSAFTINENVYASEIEAYNQHMNITYYYFIRSVTAGGYGDYSEPIIVRLKAVNYSGGGTATPEPIVVVPTASPTDNKTTDTSLHVGDRVTKSKLIYTVTANTDSKHTLSVVKPVKKTYKSITIPASIKIDGVKYKVTQIKANAFKSNKKLEKVVIGSNIKKIGKNAFYKCKKLGKVTFKGKKVSSIGKDAFKGIKSNCKIVIPKAVLSKYRKLIKKSA